MREEAAAREAAEKKELELQETQNRIKNIETLMANAGVPLVYIREGCCLENFKGKLPTSRPSFISGHGTGVGKTFLAVAYLREELLKLGGAGKFLRAVDLSTDLREALKSSYGGDTEVLNRYSRSPFLILDDLGAEKVTEFVMQTLYALIDYRYGECLPTIITSNFSLDQVASHYGLHGERLASRIASMGGVLSLSGKDRRLQK